MADIANSYAPEIVCLAAQTLATIYTLAKLRDNSESFPVKQLSPIMTGCALMCYILANIMCFIGRIIEDANSYYDPTRSGFQCRT